MSAPITIACYPINNDDRLIVGFVDTDDATSYWWQLRIRRLPSAQASVAATERRGGRAR